MIKEDIFGNSAKGVSNMIGSNRSKEDCNAPITSRRSVVDDSPANDYIMARATTVSQRSTGDYTDMVDTYDDNYDDNRAPMVGRIDECSPGSDVSASGSHSDKGTFTNLPMKTARSSGSQPPSVQDEKQMGSDEYEEWISQTSQISDASKQEISSIDDNTELTCDAGHTSLVDDEENSHDLLVGFVERPRRHLDETYVEPLSDTHIYMESEERSGYDLSYQAELDLEDRNGSVQQSQDHEEEEECDDCTTNQSMCNDGEGSSLTIPLESGYRLPELQAAMIELSKQTLLPKETRAVLKVRIEEGAAFGEEGRVPFSRPTIGNFYSQSERALVDDEDSYNGEEDDKISSDNFTPAVPSYVTKVEGEDSLLDAIKHSTAQSQTRSGDQRIENFGIASGPLNSRSPRPKTKPSNDQQISKKPISIATVVEQDSIEDFNLDDALKTRNRKVKAQPSTALASCIAALPSFGAGTAYQSRKSSTKNRLRQYGSGGRRFSGDTSSTGVRGSSGALDRTSHSAAPGYQQSMSGALDRTSHSAAPGYQQSTSDALDRTSHSAAPRHNQYQQSTFLRPQKVRRSTMSHATGVSSLHEQLPTTRRSTLPHVTKSHNFGEAESVGTNSLEVGRARRESIALHQQQKVTVRNAIPSVTKSHNDDAESVGGYSLDIGRGRREFIALRHQEQQHARGSSMSHAEMNHEFDDAESMGGYSIEAGGRIQATSLLQQQHTTRRSNMAHIAKNPNFEDAESVGRYSLENDRGRSQCTPLQNQQPHDSRSTMSRTTKSHYADDAVSVRDGVISTSLHSASINQRNTIRRVNSMAETPNTYFGGRVAHHDVHSNVESRRPQRRSTMDHASSFVSENRQRKSSQTSTPSYKSKDDFAHEKGRTNIVESYTLNSTKYRNEASSQIMTSTQGKMDHNTRRLSQSIAHQSNIPAANVVDEDDDDDDAASVDSIVMSIATKGETIAMKHNIPAANVVDEDDDGDDDDATSVDSMVMSIAIKGKTIALKNNSSRVKGSSVLLGEQKTEMRKHASKELDREIWRGLGSSGGTVLSGGGTTKYGPTPSRNSMSRLPIDVECWLEHCREPVALQKVKQKRNSTGARIGAREYSIYNRTLDSLVASESKQMDLERAMIKAGLKKRIDPSKDSLSDMAKSSKLMKSMYHNFERQSGFTANLGKGKQVRRSSLSNETKVTLADLTVHSQDRSLPSHRTFPKSIFRVVCLLPGNEKCCDCATGFRDPNTLWASVTYGILLCEQCAFRHVNKYGESNVKEVLKTITNGDWDFLSMLAMVEGGNKVMIDHMRKHDKSFRALQATESKRSMSLGLGVGLASGGNSDKDEAFSKIYLSKAAASYGKEISQRVADAILREQGASMI